MDQATPGAAGVVFGRRGFLAPAPRFERARRTGTRVSVGAGIASILASFLVMSCAILAVRLLSGSGFVEFGFSMVASFLVFWGVEAVRAWRAANGRQ